MGWVEEGLVNWKRSFFFTTRALRGEELESRSEVAHEGSPSDDEESVATAVDGEIERRGEEGVKKDEKGAVLGRKKEGNLKDGMGNEGNLEPGSFLVVRGFFVVDPSVVELILASSSSSSVYRRFYTKKEANKV